MTVMRIKSLVAAALLVVVASVSAAKNKAGTMEIVGHSGVSAQMMFLGTENKVYILDKTEKNPAQIDGHPAWAVEYDINTNKYRTMDVRSNTFCAGGMVMGDGRWLVTGGNKATTTNGATAPQGEGYGAYNGGKSLRFLRPCDDKSCSWNDRASNRLDTERWYPTVELLGDGSNIIIGGMRNGGFVPTQPTNNPTYEFYPPRGGGTSRYMPILERSVPLSLFPIAYAMSSGEVFVQANRDVILWNLFDKTEQKLPTMPGAPRVYPASGGSAMLPLTPDNDYKETILFCGGMNLGKTSNWGDEGGPYIPLSQRPASTSCEQISPLAGASWHKVDDLPEGRSMGQFIQLPDGKLWFGNGAKTGAAGYSTNPGNVGQPVGESFADHASLKPLVYNPQAEKGRRWKQVGHGNVARMYHSSATLLPDSSILVAGSNPNSDYNKDVKFPTEYRVERWYPEWYDEDRPSNAGLPDAFHYGGKGFSLKFDTNSEAAKAKVVIIRTGFSTHAMNMGQRMIELKTFRQGAVLQVGQLPPNPNLFPPGPALAFVVVDGVASQGKMIMVGNGRIGKQPTHPDTEFTTTTSSAPKTKTTARSTSKSTSCTTTTSKASAKTTSSNKSATKTTSRPASTSTSSSASASSSSSSTSSSSSSSSSSSATSSVSISAAGPVKRKAEHDDEDGEYLLQRRSGLHVRNNKHVVDHL